MAQVAVILQTLELLRPALAGIAGPWRIIGSAALVLHGIEGVVAQDIDVMLGADDGAKLVDRGGFARLPVHGGGRFRSDVHARRDDLPMPVELMGGFSVLRSGGLHPVHVGPPVLCHGWPVASLTDLVAMFRLFDRPKDRMRLKLLSQT